MNICIACGRRFNRDNYRGRPPVRCPACRERVKEKWREDQKKKKEK